MPILTLTLGQVALSTHPLHTPRLLIGSHPEADLRIDSLAVAPRHAELIAAEDGYRVQGLDPEYPIRVNGEDPSDTPLGHGDSFFVGAYRIFYGEEGQALPLWEPDGTGDTPTRPAPPIPNPPPAAPSPTPETTGSAYLQILNGPRIGRLLPIDQPCTALIRGEPGEIDLIREGDDYLLQLRQTTRRVLVDGVPVGEAPLSLRSGQELQIGPLRLWFFVR
jgi:hypothetical protein